MDAITPHRHFPTPKLLPQPHNLGSHVSKLISRATPSHHLQAHFTEKYMGLLIFSLRRKISSWLNSENIRGLGLSPWCSWVDGECFQMTPWIQRCQHTSFLKPVDVPLGSPLLIEGFQWCTQSCPGGHLGLHLTCYWVSDSSPPRRESPAFPSSNSISN